ncbi:hypothetical protein [Burkholderia gladioli]|nr:type II toxin-antitoxin system RelE/ParE family toxin [Burkholderia gladioli]
MGVALSIVQLGGTPNSDNLGRGWAPVCTNCWKTTGGDTFGAVYTVRAADAMHLLHAFQKKSKCGIATP